ncbi:MAG TPA: hypothetical protein DEB06_03290 [Phycisphaerales bacterium]|nr:hypothetical protein [Phycisphaerales bacterium]
MDRRRLNWLRGAGLSVAAMLSLGGCNIVGPLYVVASGPPKTPAAVELDEDRNHVIFIDDFRSRLPRRSLRTLMAESAETTLLEKGVLSSERLISSAAASRVASGETADERLPIADVGKRIGADVVIYVTVDGWLLSRDGQSAAPAVLTRVKIIDVAQNKRVWPANPEGQSLAIQPSQMQGDLPMTLAGRSELEQDLAKQFGLALAQMFYEHETRDSARK